jgi:flagellar biosynthesis/type III secretory pathway chaperone
MTALSHSSSSDHTLAADVLAHLDVQLSSARRLLSIVLEQGGAIRARAVHKVVELAGLLQAELERRTAIERERASLLARAGSRLGIDASEVTLVRLCAILDGETADALRERSAALRELLREIRREHETNRGLMSHQLAFLDHLLALADVDHTLGYGAAGRTRKASTKLTTSHRVLDLEV